MVCWVLAGLGCVLVAAVVVIGFDGCGLGKVGSVVFWGCVFDGFALV